MDNAERTVLLKQITWDYNISPEEVDAVLKGEKGHAGHLSQEKLFIRLLESYSWFTILQLFDMNQIQSLLTVRVVSKLRSASLRKKYDFVRKRLQQIIPAAG